jgi:hypothetical protein
MRNLAPLSALALALAACTTIPGTESGQKPAETVSDRARESAPQAPEQPQTYTRDEIVSAAKGFFGNASADIAKLIERSFSDYGEPVAYIEGEEGAGAFVVGLRYGQGYLQYKGGGRGPVFWQGPSIGFDYGGNASKVFTLVYNLRKTDQLFQRYPGVDGSLYVIAGFGLNYQRSDDVTLAPIRTGVGLRAGASVGYVHYTREPRYLPF